MQYCSLQHQTLLSPPDTSTPGHYLHFGSASSLFLELFLCSSPVAYWTPTDLQGQCSSSSFISFYLFFILLMGFSRQEYWSGLSLSSPVDHVLSPAEAWTNSGLPSGQGYWQQQSWEACPVDISPFAISPITEPLSLSWTLQTPGLVHLRPNYREGPQPHPSAENWIEDLLSMTLPTRARHVFPTASPSHQEACMSLLSSSIREQTGKARMQSHGLQNENHSHRELTKMITWITALSNSMKLWTMRCRATQDSWVMVDSSDKTGSTGEGNGKLVIIT